MTSRKRCGCRIVISRGPVRDAKPPDQYGDSCDACGAHYQTTELIDPVSTVSGNPPVLKESTHYFFRLSDYEDALKELFATGLCAGFGSE